MKILVVGGGGREHTLVWKISQSSRIKEIFCAPGNSGIAELATCLPIKPTDIQQLASFAEREKVDLTVVGPELPLTLGIVDEFSRRGLKIFGATRRAAELEGSKVFAKEFMRKYGIPTAQFSVCTTAEEAFELIKKRWFSYPVVFKADGLAAGKGSIIVEDEAQAREVVGQIMVERRFGDAGDRMVVEEFMRGEEVSFKVITDGKKVIPLAASQDHKAVYDDDKGPNTGGMGAFSPSPMVDEALHRQIMEEIIYPTVVGMAKEGREYRGVLYAGLMITEGGPKVLEFNARFGDPESQVVLPRMEGDLVPLLEGVVAGSLEGRELTWRDAVAICVVLASGGYPGSYEKGKEIYGLSEAARLDDVLLFHAGTERRDDSFLTAGGRVLGVTAIASTFPEAINRAYNACQMISFEGTHYRRDIGRKALRWLGK